MTNVFLGVTSKNKWKIVKPGDKSYWCVYPNCQVSNGDFLFIYKTVLGIVQIYAIISSPYQSHYLDCSIRNMLTIDTKLIATFPNPLTAKEIKTNPILMKSGPVGRNFQMTTFTLLDNEWKEIVHQLAIKNPAQSDALPQG